MTAPRELVHRALLAWVVFALPLPASGQMQVGAELTRDRSTWRFDAPSAYDTAELVPHFFEQAYVLDNLWIAASVAYRAGADWRTSVGATPIRTATATDYDTFFDPGDVLWTAGTTGDARVHSFRFTQEVDMGRRGATAFTGGYRVRVDLADFLEGDRTDTRNGMLVARQIVTTREYTTAQTHEVFVGAAYARDMSTTWTARFSGEASPVAINRLAIELPDKYPGETLIFRATNAALRGRLELARLGARWSLHLAALVERSIDYRSTPRASRSRVGADVSVSAGW